MKLESVTVVDLSVLLPGPYLTMRLADHGARVLKIEPPGGDPGRDICFGPVKRISEALDDPRQEQNAPARAGVAP